MGKFVRQLARRLVVAVIDSDWLGRLVCWASSNHIVVGNETECASCGKPIDRTRTDVVSYASKPISRPGPPRNLSE